LRRAHFLLSRKKAGTCYVATQANYSASSRFLNVVIHHPEGSRLLTIWNDDVHGRTKMFAEYKHNL